MGQVRSLGRHNPELTAAVDEAAAALVMLMTRGDYAVPTVPTSQLRVLVLLRQHTAMNVTALAESLSALPSSASRLCDRLAAAGLVERETDPRHRRNVTITLTRDGRELLERVDQARRAALHTALGGMSATGRTQLLAGLQQLNQALNSAEPANAEDVDHNHA